MRSFYAARRLRAHGAQVGLNCERELLAEYVVNFNQNGAAVTRRQMLALLLELLRTRRDMGDIMLSTTEKRLLDSVAADPGHMPHSDFFAKFEEEHNLKSGPIHGKSGNRHDKYTEAVVDQWQTRVMGTLEEEGMLIVRGRNKGRIEPTGNVSTPCSTSLRLASHPMLP